MSSDSTIGWVPFSQRDEWKDVKGIALDEGKNPVCPINYSHQFQETMDYFRAVLHTDEHSERSLQLTRELVQINPASYTAWFFRRKTLITLKSDLNKELEFLSALASRTPKNYQLWYHRRWVVELLNDASQELDFTASILDQDGKNYHAWAHRQWVLSHFKLWTTELDWLDATVLVQDRRNNSAWNQRYFVISSTKNVKDLAVQKQEIAYAWQWIRKSPNNQSPWSYMGGFIAFDSLDADEFWTKLKQELEAFAAKYITCAHAHSLLIDFYERDGSPQALKKAIEFTQLLATRLAQMHAKYWQWRQLKLENQLLLLNKNE